MKNFTLKENEKLTAEIIDGCAVFTIEEKNSKHEGFRGKLMEDVPVFEAGKWYESKYYEGSCPAIALYNGDKIMKGFGFLGSYSESITVSSSEWKPADMEEVGKLMIAEAEERGYKGGKFKNLYLKDDIIHFSITSDIFLNSVGLFIEEGNMRYTLWTPEKGWAEIIEPLFINSHGTKFYKGDTVYWVNKHSMILQTSCISKINRHVYTDSSSQTELLTKEQAEAYVKDHTPKRVFEDGSYYEVVLDSNPDIAYWNGYFFEMIGKNSELQPEEFESISANRIKLGK